MNGDGPIAVRDFPEGCVKMPRRESRNPRPPRARERADADQGEVPHFKLAEDFAELSPRSKFLERRRVYSQLLKYYKTTGKVAGHRPDLQAMRQMNEQGMSYDGHILGDVPGVLVGDSFDYRSEMFAVGLHRQVQGGIAWIKTEGDRFACSVVSSGGYRDDADNGETVKYTGQGGNNYKGDRKQLEDQKLNLGNKALINSYKRGALVRMIRGHGEKSGWNKIYSYDGLYKVTNYDLEVGKDGHKVYTFTLDRLADQPPLDIAK